MVTLLALLAAAATLVSSAALRADRADVPAAVASSFRRLRSPLERVADACPETIQFSRVPSGKLSLIPVDHISFEGNACRRFDPTLKPELLFEHVSDRVSRASFHVAHRVGGLACGNAKPLAGLHTIMWAPDSAWYSDIPRSVHDATVDRRHVSLTVRNAVTRTDNVCMYEEELVDTLARDNRDEDESSGDEDRNNGCMDDDDDDDGIRGSCEPTNTGSPNGGPGPDNQGVGDDDDDDDDDPNGSGNGGSGNTGVDGVDFGAGAGDDDVCFPEHSTVQLESGAVKRMSEVAIGDRIRVSPTQFSEVFMFTHKVENTMHEFLTLRTHGQAKITLTQGHYLYVNGELAPARAVSAGDSVELADGKMAVVVDIQTISARGLYNPQTVHGDVIVDGVRASTYTTTVEKTCAHALLFPLRSLYKVLGYSSTAFNNGAHMLASIAPKGH